MTNPMTPQNNTLQEGHDQRGACGEERIEDIMEPQANSRATTRMKSLGMHAMPTTALASTSAPIGAMERLLNHFQHLTFVRLRPSSIQNGTYGGNRAAFFTNNFANVLLRHPEFDDDRVFSLNTSYMHFFWFLHNGLGNLLNQFLHG